MNWIRFRIPRTPLALAVGVLLLLGLASTLPAQLARSGGVTVERTVTAKQSSGTAQITSPGFAVDHRGDLVLALLSRRIRRRYTPEFKAEVIELIRTSGNSVAQVARDLGVNHTTVHN